MSQPYILILYYSLKGNTAAMAQEVALLSMQLPLLHHGMLIVGIPYTETNLFMTMGGGTPYGLSHVAGINSDEPLTDAKKMICRTLGKRLGTVALKLQ